MQGLIDGAWIDPLYRARQKTLSNDLFLRVYCRWLRDLDLNQGPSGYEPDELPGCSTPRWYVLVLFLRPQNRPLTMLVLGRFVVYVTWPV